MAFNDKYEEMRHQVSVLAQQALEKLQNEDYEGFKNDWDEANRVKINLDAYMESESGIMEMKYGQNLNMGIIMNVILENMSQSMNEGDKSKAKQIGKIITKIQNDKVLFEQFKVYNGLTNKEIWNGVNPELSEKYVNEVVSSITPMNKKDAKSHNRELIEMIVKGNLDENVMIDNETINLYESIECLLFKRNTFSDLNKLTEAKENISQYLREHVITEKKEVIDFNTKLSELTEKYENELNDDEKKLIEQVQNANDKEGMFNEYKTKTLKTLSESLKTYEGNDKTELQEVINKINEKKFNEKTMLVDIAEMIEVMNVMKD